MLSALHRFFDTFIDWWYTQVIKPGCNCYLSDKVKENVINIYSGGNKDDKTWEPKEGVLYYVTAGDTLEDREALAKELNIKFPRNTFSPLYLEVESRLIFEVSGDKLRWFVAQRYDISIGQVRGINVGKTTTNVLFSDDGLPKYKAVGTDKTDEVLEILKCEKETSGHPILMAGMFSVLGKMILERRNVVLDTLSYWPTTAEELLKEHLYQNSLVGPKIKPALAPRLEEILRGMPDDQLLIVTGRP